MPPSYFIDTPYQVVDGNIVYASDLNNPFSAIATAFATLVADIQTDNEISYSPDVGAVDAYAINLSPDPGEYKEGLNVWLKPAASNTGPSTLNVNGLGPIEIRRIGLEPLSANDLPANYYVHLKYSAGYFQIVSNVGTPDASALLSAQAAAASAALAKSYADQCTAMEQDLGNPSQDDMFLSSKTDGTRAWKFPGLGAMPTGVKMNWNIVGLKCVPNSTTPATHIDITPGKCADHTNTIYGINAATATIDASATYGVGNGGLLGGTFTANKNWNVYGLIPNAGGEMKFGVLDATLDIDTYCPANHTYIWLWVLPTDGSGNLQDYTINEHGGICFKGNGVFITSFSDSDGGGSPTATEQTIDLSTILPVEYLRQIRCDHVITGTYEGLWSHYVIVVDSGASTDSLATMYGTDLKCVFSVYNGSGTIYFYIKEIVIAR